MMFRRCLLLSVLAFGTQACTTKVDGLYISDSFKPDTLKKENLVTGGVVTVAAGYKPDESKIYSAVMFNRFRDERKELKLRPVETLMQALGEQAYTATLETYRKSGLDAASLGQIASKLRGVRFVALAQIASNVTEKGQSREAAHETKDDKGNVTKHPEKITKTHKRTVLATLHIYDLDKKELAFSGQITKTDENSKTYSVGAIGNVLSVVNAIQGKDNEKIYPTPEAPETREVLGAIFEGFAENFPKD